MSNKVREKLSSKLTGILLMIFGILLIVGALFSGIYGKEDIERDYNYSLNIISEVYSNFQEGEEVYFLNSKNNPIKVDLISKENYVGEIYDVDVANDIVLVRRDNSSEIWSGNSNFYSPSLNSFLLESSEANISVTSPVDNYNYSSGNESIHEVNVSVNFSASDAFGIDNVWYNYSLDSNSSVNGSNISASGVSSIVENITLEDGNYTINFYANNTEGTLLESIERSFKVDTNKPNVSSTNPENNTNISAVNTNSSGYALSFDGVDDYVDVGNDDSLNIGTNNYTLSVWIKPSGLLKSDNSDYIIFSKYQSSSERFYFRLRQQDYAQFYSRVGGNTYNSIDNKLSQDFNNNEWALFTAIVDRSSDKPYFYKNGFHIGTGNTLEASGVDISNTGNGQIGSYNDGSAWHYDGSIDEVRIYNRSLSSDEISGIYNSGRLSNPQLTTEGLVSWWDFENGSGTTATDRIGSNDGTLYDDTSWELNCDNGICLNMSANFSDDTSGVKNGTLTIYNDSDGSGNYTEYYSEDLNNTDGLLSGSMERVVDFVDGMYKWFWKVWDWSGNSEVTSNSTIRVDLTSPQVVSVVHSPNTNDTLDPNTTITFNASITDNFLGVDSVLLKYNNGSGWENESMDFISGSSINGIWQYNLTLQDEEANYSWNVWVNDTVGNVNNSWNSTGADTEIKSTWDCTWSIVPGEFEEASGYDTNKEIGTITINNTGDAEYNNDGGCNIGFDFDYNTSMLSNNYFIASGQDSRSSSGEELISGIKVNGEYLHETQVSSGESLNLSVRAGFPESSSILTENTQVIVHSNITHTEDENDYNYVNSTFIVAKGAVIYQNIVNPSSSYVEFNLTRQNISLGSYLRNLGADNSSNNTAYNVSFNWTIPSQLQPFIKENLTERASSFYSGLANDSKIYNNLTLVLDDNMESNEISVTENPSVKINSKGYENSTGNLSLIIYGDNQTVLEDSFIISFSCDSTSNDSICPSTCTYDSSSESYDPDCTKPSSGDSPGGGGGGSSASLGQDVEQFFSTHTLELLRGEEQSFELPINNPYSKAVIRDIFVQLEGFESDKIKLLDNAIFELKPLETKNLTVLINAPSYFPEGKHNLSFKVRGKKIENKTSISLREEIVVRLNLLEIPREEAKEHLDNSVSYFNYINGKGYDVSDLSVYLKKVKENYDNVIFSQVQLYAEKIEDDYEAVRLYENLTDELWKDMEKAEREGIKTFDTRSMVFLAEAAFVRGAYQEAIKRLNEAQLTYAVEVKGEFHPLYYTKNHPFRVSSGVLLLALFSFGTSLISRWVLLKRKMRVLDQEEQLLIGLMKVVQRETFDKGRMSMSEYGNAMFQYERRLREVVQGKISAETALANLFKFRGKEKALNQERERLLGMIKQTQKEYLEEGKLETRVYENMLKSYSKRLAEVEERIAFLYAKKELKKRKIRFKSLKLLFTGKTREQLREEKSKKVEAEEKEEEMKKTKKKKESREEKKQRKAKEKEEKKLNKGNKKNNGSEDNAEIKKNRDVERKRNVRTVSMKDFKRRQKEKAEQDKKNKNNKGKNKKKGMFSKLKEKVKYGMAELKTSRAVRKSSKKNYQKFVKGMKK